MSSSRKILISIIIIIVLGAAIFFIYYSFRNKQLLKPINTIINTNNINTAQKCPTISEHLKKIELIQDESVRKETKKRFIKDLYLEFNPAKAWTQQEITDSLNNKNLNNLPVSVEDNFRYYFTCAAVSENIIDYCSLIDELKTEENWYEYISADQKKEVIGLTATNNNGWCGTDGFDKIYKTIALSQRDNKCYFGNLDYEYASYSKTKEKCFSNRLYLNIENEVNQLLCDTYINKKVSDSNVIESKYPALDAECKFQIKTLLNPGNENCKNLNSIGMTQDNCSNFQNAIISFKNRDESLCGNLKNGFSLSGEMCHVFYNVNIPWCLQRYLDIDLNKEFCLNY